ncbi:MAG: Stp1/IreP family PP2C-type Ser/Thr phosphatase [Polyangiaceae bacterium]|nr:Stp1/IreP family PP2C-type Ser/Thr phosphatase [Polyangiaceae bacterium]
MSETPDPPPPAPSEPVVEPAIETDDEQVDGGPIRVRLFGRTDVGQVREHNEDNFIVADLSRKTRGLLEGDRVQLVGPRGTLMAVCDGMGGAAAGEVASQLAVDIIYERMSEGDAPKDRDDIARRIVRSIEEAGSRIYSEAKADRSRRGMGTTSTVAALVDDHLFLGQVGDSRCYVLRNGKLVQVTRDQSLVNQLIEAGQLTEEEAETFEHNNIILQALGTSETVQVDLTYVHLRRGDIVMLCSDGLSGMMKSDELREVLANAKDPLEACKTLTDRANQAGGHDNITCIVATFEGAGLKKLDPAEGDLKYRKYTLPELRNDETTQPVRTADLKLPPSSGHGGLKVANTMVGMSVKDIEAALPPGTLRGDSGPQAGHDDPVDLPIPPTPPWMVALWLLIAIAIVGAAGFYLLRTS